MSTKYYESQQKILERMLGRINGLSTIEGSTTYIQHSPMAIELENVKLQMDEIVNRNNIITAYENGYEDEVVKYAEADGVDRKQSHYSVGKQTFFGTPNTVVPVGTKFGDEANGRMYETLTNGTIDNTGKCTVLSKSCDNGLKYNANPSELKYLPIKISGVTGTTNEEKYTGGTDIESIDDLFYRHQLKVRASANGCNKAQYELWATSVDGVGSVKVYSLKDETLTTKRGHVCIVITDSDRKGATPELCQKVKDYIDPNDGDGSGVAPVNAIVHVISAVELPLNFELKLKVETGYVLDEVKQQIVNVFAEYLKKNAFSTTTLSVTRLGSLIYTVDGVKDYTDLLINGADDVVNISENEIAVVGDVIVNA